MPSQTTGDIVPPLLPCFVICIYLDCQQEEERGSQAAEGGVQRSHLIETREALPVLQVFGPLLVGDGDLAEINHHRGHGEEYEQPLTIAAQEDKISLPFLLEGEEFRDHKVDHHKHEKDLGWETRRTFETRRRLD